MSPRCLLSSFSSIRHSVPEEMSFEEFQDGCHGDHLGYWNRTILAILNLHVTPMPPIKFQLIRTFRGGGDVVQRISTAAMAAFLDIGTEVFSNSESPCHPDDSHQVSAQSHFWFGRRCCLKNFRIAAMAAIMVI